jgi:hypothetical protein
MARLPCSYCDRVPRKSLYARIFAWHTDGHRVAIKTRACHQCDPLGDQLLGGPLPEDSDYVQLPASCPACNEPLLAQEVVLIYLTGWNEAGKRERMFGGCASCASEACATLVQHGERLPERDLSPVRRGP